MLEARVNAEGVKRWVVNRLGWKADRKYLVLESDDWGTIRMASLDAFRRLEAKGYPVDECPYNRFDMLESEADIRALTETLTSFEDHVGRPAVMTANVVVGNPDFDAIRANGASVYVAEPFWETLRRQGEGAALDAYREARDAGALHPQLHGREHVAVERWLEALRAEDRRFRDAFEERMFTVHPGGATTCHRDLLDPFAVEPGESGFDTLPVALEQAQSWFETFWGHRSESFIAPCYTWHGAVEASLRDIGVRFLQGSRVQRVPDSTSRHGIRRLRRYTGQRNAHGQRYLVRNVSLEPSLDGNEERCLDNASAEVAAAFHHRTPAIVSSHRLNYMGGLDASNRERGLRVLASFLTSVQRAWPDVEFVSSDHLGRLMEA